MHLGLNFERALTYALHVHGGLELLLFQVTVLDKFDNPAGVPMVTLSRMYRVQARFFFPIEGQF